MVAAAIGELHHSRPAVRHLGRKVGMIGNVEIHDYSGDDLEQIARQSFVPVILRTRPGFSGRIALQEMGSAVTLSRAYSGGPHRMLRTERLAAKTSGDDVLLFIVHMAGATGVRQHDRFAELAVGAGVLSEARSPWEIVCPSESSCLLLSFSRELLALRSAKITESCGRGIDPVAPGMQLLSSYLKQLFDLAGRLTAEQRLDASQAAIDLLAMALRDVTPSMSGGDGSMDVLLDMMLTHVRDHLADPRLRVEELARRHHVSVRRAYTLFERIGTTPGAYLREQRLLAARAMLSDPRYARLCISDVAGAVGFLERRSFELAFRRECGMTPGAWRREHLRVATGPATAPQKNSPGCAGNAMPR
jgi:AraC-like DNA-binding protein